MKMSKTLQTVLFIASPRAITRQRSSLSIDGCLAYFQICCYANFYLLELLE